MVSRQCRMVSNCRPHLPSTVFSAFSGPFCFNELLFSMSLILNFLFVSYASSTINVFSCAFSIHFPLQVYILNLGEYRTSTTLQVRRVFFLFCLLTHGFPRLHFDNSYFLYSRVDHFLPRAVIIICILVLFLKLFG